MCPSLLSAAAPILDESETSEGQFESFIGGLGHGYQAAWRAEREERKVACQALCCVYETLYDELHSMLDKRCLLCCVTPWMAEASSCKKLHNQTAAKSKRGGRIRLPAQEQKVC